MITDPILLSLQAAISKPNSEGYTVAELLDKTQLEGTERNKNKIRAFLKAEIAAGRMIGKTGRRPIISGRIGAVPVFVLVDKKKK